MSPVLRVHGDSTPMYELLRAGVVDAAWYATPANDDRIATVIDGTLQCAYPRRPRAPARDEEGKQSRHHYPVPCERVFSTAYGFDAFVLPYVYAPAMRLSNGFFDDADLADDPDLVPCAGGGFAPRARPRGLRMWLLVVDVDQHGAPPPEGIPAWQDTALARIRDTLPPSLRYRTKRGVRAVWRVDRTITDHEEWRQFALAWYEHFDRATGLESDKACANFARHFRLPYVRRDGVEQDGRLEGDLATLLDWHPPGPTLPTEGFFAPRRASRGRARGAEPGGTSDDPVIVRALASGLAAASRDAGKYLVFCPTRRHGGGALTSQTVVWARGAFSCLGADCSHVTRAEWEATIPPDATDTAAVVSTVDEVRAVIDGAVREAGVGYRLVVTDTPPGSGKSHHARGLLARGAIRPGEAAGVLLTPTVALALQHHERTGAELRAGPRHVLAGRGVCRKPGEVDFAYSLGLTAAPVCVNCEYRTDCTARAPVGDASKGVLATHERAGEFAAAERVVMVDEWPNTALRTWTLPKSGLVDAIERVVPPCKRDGSPVEGRAEALAWAKTIEAGTFDDHTRWLAGLACGSTPHVHLHPSASVKRAERAGSAPVGFFDAAMAGLSTYRRDVEIAVGVWRSSRADARFSDDGDCWTVTGLADVLWTLQQRGGLLLASGAPAGILRALRPDVDLRRVERVADGRAIRRVMVATADMSTRKLKTERGTVLLKRVIADVIRRAEEFGALPGEVAIFTAKAFAGVVASAAPGVKVGTFGGLRGKDAWMGCKVFAVIGDHFENDASNEREAEYFGVDAAALWTEKVACEKEQAFGRAREPRPGAPALLLCYGRVVPNRWAGRCETETWGDSKIGARVQALKTGGATQRAIAEILGVSQITVKRHWYAANAD